MKKIVQKNNEKVCSYFSKVFGVRYVLCVCDHLYDLGCEVDVVKRT